MPYSIIYRSKTKENFTSSQIEIMLIKAKRFNKQNDITGCIIYNCNEFIQIIEGKEDNIKKLYSKIINDDRHYDVKTLIDKQSDTMLWNDWSMAFYKFTKDPEKNRHNRILLEAYFNNVSEDRKASEVYTILKENVSDLLKFE